jgi:hypothetical protein
LPDLFYRIAKKISNGNVPFILTEADVRGGEVVGGNLSP